MQEQIKSSDGLHMLNKEGISFIYFSYDSEWKVGDKNAVKFKNNILVKINKFLKENPGYEVLSIEDIVKGNGLISNGLIKEVGVWLVKKDKIADDSVNKEWIKLAYPLQQVKIVLQGTKNSKKINIINELKSVLARLESGEDFGEEHDDDYGYYFEYLNDVTTSQFKTPFGRR